MERGQFRRDYPNDWNRIIEMRTGYNTNGSVIFIYDQPGTGQPAHLTNFDYADSYSDAEQPRGTYAYPTTVTDPETYASTTQYKYDTGAVTDARAPGGRE